MISKEGRGNKESVEGSEIRVDELGNTKISSCYIPFLWSIAKKLLD